VVEERRRKWSSSKLDSVVEIVEARSERWQQAGKESSLFWMVEAEKEVEGVDHEEVQRSRRSFRFSSRLRQK